MNEKDKKLIINSLTMTINHLDDATESFVSECFDLRNRLENLKPSDNNDFKKPCPACKGSGLRQWDMRVEKDNKCSTCNGQGFIKS